MLRRMNLSSFLMVRFITLYLTYLLSVLSFLIFAFSHSLVFSLSYPSFHYFYFFVYAQMNELFINLYDKYV